MFLIPIPTAQTIHGNPVKSSDSGSATPASLQQDETPTPEKQTIEKPRPVYKQFPAKNDSSPAVERVHRPGRTRRRVKIGDKKGNSFNLIALAVGGGLLLVLVVGLLIWSLTSKPKTSTPATNLLSGKSVLDQEPDPFDGIPKTYRMPMSWSKTDREKYGFDLFWPVKGSKAGYTNEADLMTRGMPIEFWSYTNKEKNYAYSLEQIPITEIQHVDIENTLKRFTEKLRQDGLNKIQQSEREMDGRRTLLVTGIKNKMRSTLKIQWTPRTLWVAKVECPESESFNDSNVWDFLLSFKLEQ
ncbi:MAG: hypothetical protein U0798_08925 [Gemmataceae bacterium]